MDNMPSFKFISNFSDYVNKSADKVQWLKVFRVSAKTESDVIAKLTDMAKNELYDVYFFNEESYKKTIQRPIDKEAPILRYGAGNINIALYVNKMGLNSDTFYNTPDTVKISGDKAKWHILFDGKPYIPKTVFSKEEAISKLKFPIVGKPSMGHSGLGIVKFKTIEDLKSNNDKFDLFSEWVSSSAEYRALCVKDNIVLLYERIPRIDLNKTVETKKKDEEVQFIYIEQDMSRFKQLQELRGICADMRKLLPLGVFSLDFLTDKNDKIWVLENNSNSGLAAMSLAALYVGIYKDFYKKDPPQKKMEIVDEIISKYREEIKKMYPGEYKKSKNPV